MTSLAHRTCTACRGGQPERIIPWTRSARSTNRTRGMQHVELRTRAGMGTRLFQIQSLVAILAIHATVSFETRDVHTPAS